MGSLVNDPLGATEFVRSLFQNVLGISDATEARLAPWIARAVAIGDPLEFYKVFVAHKINTDRLRAAADSATLLPNGHFYSPVVSRADVAEEWERLTRPRQPACIEIDIDGQLRTWHRLANSFATLPFPNNAALGKRYHFLNPTYSFGDASIYWGMLNLLRPRRIIEVGSGFSSAMVLDAIDALDLPTACTFIDPYPQLAEKVTAPLRPPHRVLGQKIQHIDPDMVRGLEENDILFIDSSHVVKTGSDVHFELFELIPQLQPGVVVHFHDIFYPFEYPSDWVLNLNRSWNEAYFVHAFLMYNSAFEIVFFNTFFAREFREIVRATIPAHADRFLRNPGGGLWLRTSKKENR